MSRESASKAARGQDRTIPHAELSPAEYLGSRLEDQRGWYEDKAALYSSRARVWRAVALALALGGAVISGIAAAVAGTTFLGAWVGVTGYASRNCRGACCRVAIFLSGADL